jgi:hypothetical protein
MKKLALLLPLVFVAGVVMAQDAPKPADAQKPAAAATKAVAKTHESTVEFVSADATKKTITVKDSGAEKTVALEGKALASVKSLKANQKVTVTYLENEKGEATAVTEIQIPVVK